MAPSASATSSAARYQRDGLFVRELLRRDIGRELAVVDRAVGFAEAGRLGEVVRERAIVRSSAGAAELFEATPGQLVQPHALTHGHGLEQARSARRHAGSGTAAAFRAARRDSARARPRRGCRAADRRRSSSATMRNNENSNSGPVTAALRRSSAVAGSRLDTRFTTSSMTRSGGRTGWRVAAQPHQVVRLQLLRERRDEERVAARLRRGSHARGRATGSAASRCPSDSVTMATTSAASRPPSVHAPHGIPARSRRPSSAASSCSGTSSSRHVATSMPGEAGRRGNEVLQHRQRRAGRPLQVVEHEQHRPAVGDERQPAEHRFVQRERIAVTVGGTARGRRRSTRSTSSGTSRESCAPWRARTMPTPAGEACAR